MGTCGSSTFTGRMTNWVVYVHPLPLYHTVFRSDMKIQNVPTRLFIPITIQVYNHNSNARADYKSGGGRKNPSCIWITACRSTCRSKVQSGQGPTDFPRAVWPSGECPNCLRFEGQNDFQLAYSWWENVASDICPRPGITKHILIVGGKTASLVHDPKPLIHTMLAREVIHEGNSSSIEFWVNTQGIAVAETDFCQRSRTPAVIPCR